MEMIKLSNVTKEIKGSSLFQINDATVNQGDRIGLIGKNGTGKSTLLKMIVGLDLNYCGHIRLHQDFAYVPQIKQGTSESGGQQMKRMIEEAMAKKPPILILDEPTANLDQANIHQLMQDLEAYAGTLLVVSHNREFLNAIVSQIWEIDQGQLKVFVGNYLDYEQMKQAQLENQRQAYQNYQKKIQQLEHEVSQRRERAQTFKKKKKTISYSDYKVNSRMGKYDGQQKGLAKSAKALQKRIDQMEAVDRPQAERSYTFKSVGNLASTKGQTLINLDSGAVKVNDRLLFTFAEFTIKAGDKVAIQGANQAGKTTFLKRLVQGALKGYYADSLSIGYYDQNFEHLKKDKTVLANVAEGSLQDEAVIRNVLAALGFDHTRLNDQVAALSGGERVRLSFAKLLLGDYHLLILDEPTNFLDLQTLETVEKFINHHPAAILLVSHDQVFVEHTVDRSYYIENQQMVTDSYLAHNPDQPAKEIALLEFQLDQMIADPEVDWTEIKALKEEIRRRQNR